MAEPPQIRTTIENAIAEHLSAVESVRQQIALLERIAAEMTRALGRGNKVLWCGNGGSAADSQHLAAELVGRFQRQRRGLASLALTTDTSILTAVGNDFGFDQIFVRQVEALCVRGDVLVGISTSGNSRNVCLALEAARRLEAFTVAFTGPPGGQVSHLADAVLAIGSQSTARVQEAHILCGHILCDWVELQVWNEQQAGQHKVGR